MIKTIYLNCFQYNDSKFYGDWEVIYRFQLAQFIWSLNGLVIGGGSSPIVIETRNNTINCSRGDTIPWNELSDSWGIRFPDGIVFAQGEVQVVNSYDRWVECLPHISSSEAINCLDYLLSKKNASSPISWGEFSSLMKVIKEMKIVKDNSDVISFFEQRWQHYKLSGAIQEMTHLPPSCDAINWLKDHFLSNKVNKKG